MRAFVEGCHYCIADATTRDHIVPKSLGGPDALWNLVPACGPCNRIKSADMPTCRCERCRGAVQRVMLTPHLYSRVVKALTARRDKALTAAANYEAASQRSASRAAAIEAQLQDAMGSVWEKETTA